MAPSSGPRAYRKDIDLKLALISARVNVFSAIEKESSTHTVCVGTDTASHVPTQIKQTQACPDCGNDDGSTFRLVAVGDASAAVLTREERDAAKTESVGNSNKEVTITPHPAESVRTQTIPNGGVYYLGNSGGTTTALDHLIDAIERHPEKAFLGNYAPAGRVNLYEFRVFDGALVMTQLARTEAIKVVPQERGVLNDVWQAQMDTILDMAAAPYDPVLYTDVFAAKMAELVASKPAEEGVVLTKSKGQAVAAPQQDFAAMMAATLAAVAVDGTKKPRRKAAKKGEAA